MHCTLVQEHRTLVPTPGGCASRSLERCAAAKAELDSRDLPGSCECAQLDLADVGSIRAFASKLGSKGCQVRTLVNNAGAPGPLRSGWVSWRVSSCKWPFTWVGLALHAARL